MYELHPASSHQCLRTLPDRRHDDHEAHEFHQVDQRSNRGQLESIGRKRNEAFIRCCPRCVRETLLPINLLRNTRDSFYRANWHCQAVIYCYFQFLSGAVIFCFGGNHPPGRALVLMEMAWGETMVMTRSCHTTMPSRGLPAPRVGNGSKGREPPFMKQPRIDQSGLCIDPGPSCACCAETCT